MAKDMQTLDQSILRVQKYVDNFNFVQNPVTAICPRNMIGPVSKPRPPLSVNGQNKKNHNKSR